MKSTKTITMTEAINIISAMKATGHKAVIISDNEIRLIDMPKYGSTTFHSQAGRVVRIETTESEKI